MFYFTYLVSSWLSIFLYFYESLIIGVMTVRILFVIVLFKLVCSYFILLNMAIEKFEF